MIKFGEEGGRELLELFVIRFCVQGGAKGGSVKEAVQDRIGLGDGVSTGSDFVVGLEGRRTSSRSVSSKGRSDLRRCSGGQSRLFLLTTILGRD